MKLPFKCICATAIAAGCLFPITTFATDLGPVAQGYGGSTSSGPGQSGGNTTSGTGSGGSMGSGASPSSSGTGNSGSSSARTGAQSGNSADCALFDELDRNKNGSIDRAEANRSATAKSEFDAIDTSGSGSVSRAQWNAHFKCQ